MEKLIMFLQETKMVTQALLFASAIVSAFLTEIMTSKIGKRSENGSSEPEGRSGIVFLLLHSLICLVMFTLELGFGLFLIISMFHAIPEEGSMWVLVTWTVDYYGWSFGIPFVASVVAGASLRTVKKGFSKVLLCLLLVLAVLFGGIQFFLETFRLRERPNLPFPAEAVSAIVNSRLRAYPFALSRGELKQIGDGSELLVEEAADPPSGDVTDEPPIDAPTEIEEPTSFNGYIYAISEDAYAPGGNRMLYLRKAYEYYLAGRWTNSDYNDIGVMWWWIYHDFYGFSDLTLTKGDCLEKALDAFQKAERYSGASPLVYSNIAVVYNLQGDRAETRHYIKLAIELNATMRYTLPYYIDWINDWVSDEPYASLMDDASTVLNYGENLSMYILYGACAAADNANVERAYELLCEADTYYHGKSALVKILRCICADLMGQDESLLLREIYALEQKNSLTPTEELYLMRYLFATNRYEELWGYISDVGGDSGPSLNAELAAMKASWYFSNQASDYFTMEDAEQLLDWVEARLTELTEESEERDTLLLCRALLQSCVGQAEGMDAVPDMLTGASDLEYALMAVKAFNAGRYPEAIQACEQFFILSREDFSPPEDGDASQAQLEPQEQVTLRYYVQLVSAQSHFEYAKLLPRNSEERKSHMDAAERECAAFQQSSKSLLYIGEQFKILQNSIAIENGRIPSDSDKPIDVFPG